MSIFYEYMWKPWHNTKKITNIKAGMTIMYLGEEYKVVRVDRHVFPICLGGGLRITEKLIEGIKI